MCYQLNLRAFKRTLQDLKLLSKSLFVIYLFIMSSRLILNHNNYTIYFVLFSTRNITIQSGSKNMIQDKKKNEIVRNLHEFQYFYSNYREI